jgi:hypothetical protein
MFEIDQIVPVTFPGYDETDSELHRIVELDADKQIATTVSAFSTSRFDRETQQIPFAWIRVQCQHLYWDRQRCLSSVWRRHAPPETLPARYCFTHAVYSHGHCGLLLPRQIGLYALVSLDHQDAVTAYTTTRHSTQDALKALEGDRPHRVATWAIHLHQSHADDGGLDSALRALLGAPHDKVVTLFGGGRSDPYCGRWTEITTF